MRWLVFVAIICVQIVCKEAIEQKIKKKGVDQVLTTRQELAVFAVCYTVGLLLNDILRKRAKADLFFLSREVIVFKFS